MLRVVHPVPTCPPYPNQIVVSDSAADPVAARLCCSTKLREQFRASLMASNMETHEYGELVMALLDVLEPGSHNHTGQSFENKTPPPPQTAIVYGPSVVSHCLTLFSFVTRKPVRSHHSGQRERLRAPEGHKPRGAARATRASCASSTSKAGCCRESRHPCRSSRTVSSPHRPCSLRGCRQGRT